jgi:hypothetical protein
MDIEPQTNHILLIEDDEVDYLIVREKLLELSGQPKYVLDWEQTYRGGLRQSSLAASELSTSRLYQING